MAGYGRKHGGKRKMDGAPFLLQGNCYSKRKTERKKFLRYESTGIAIGDHRHGAGRKGCAMFVRPQPRVT